ncbi:MAG: hypothetical protein K0S30_604 [Clostridia bacterium]|jgi:hypothetical protein|nr:hypothetical protein [Clostridia bacterium]
MKIEVEINYEDANFIAEIYPFETPINSSICRSVYRNTVDEALDDVKKALNNVNFLTDEVIVFTCLNNTKRRVKSIEELERFVYEDYKNLIEGNH